MPACPSVDVQTTLWTNVTAWLCNTLCLHVLQRDVRTTAWKNTFTLLGNAQCPQVLQWRYEQQPGQTPLHDYVMHSAPRSFSGGTSHSLRDKHHCVIMQYIVPACASVDAQTTVWTHKIWENWQKNHSLDSQNLGKLTEEPQSGLTKIGKIVRRTTVWTHKNWENWQKDERRRQTFLTNGAAKKPQMISH